MIRFAHACLFVLFMLGMGQFAHAASPEQAGIFKGVFVGKSYVTTTSLTAETVPQKIEMHLWLYANQNNYPYALGTTSFAASGSLGTTDGYANQDFGPTHAELSFHFKGLDKIKGVLIRTDGEHTLEGKFSLKRVLEP